MDRELWTQVVVAVRRAAAHVGWNGGRRKPVYANRLIVAMYIWSVWHDRPLKLLEICSCGISKRPVTLSEYSSVTINAEPAV